MKKTITSKEIANMIDYALLKPQLTDEDIRKGVNLALKYNAGCIFVRPTDLDLAYEMTKDTKSNLATVIGFPHGDHSTAAKVADSMVCLEKGCDELDMVINIGKLKSGDLDFVYEDMKFVCDVIHAQGKICKVILETCYLTDEEVVTACKLAAKAGLDFVKTSTGFGNAGAKVHHLKIMSANISDTMEVKASGGIRNLDQLLSAVAAGATRIGASAIKEIVQKAELREKNGPILIEIKEDMGEGY